MKLADGTQNGRTVGTRVVASYDFAHLDKHGKTFHVERRVGFGRIAELRHDGKVRVRMDREQECVVVDACDMEVLDGQS